MTTSSRGAVSLPWESREALLREVGHRESTAGIIKAFTDAGATRAVTLNRVDRAHLFDVLEAWSLRAGLAELPPGIWDLRCALADDLASRPSRG